MSFFEDMVQALTAAIEAEKGERQLMPYPAEMPAPTFIIGDVKKENKEE